MSATILNSVPSFTVGVKDLTEASEISRMMKDRGIREYLYRVAYKGSIVAKYGMSFPKSTTSQAGERIYRQVGHMHGWETLLNSKSGADWADVENAFYQQHGIVMHKDDMVVTVWDFTQHQFQTIDRKSEIRVIEGYLIQTHIDVMGHKPAGNIKEEGKVSRTKISSDVFTSMFDVPVAPKQKRVRLSKSRIAKVVSVC